MSTIPDLAEIRRLQFVDLNRANGQLLEFFRARLPFEVRGVEIRPLAVSLNSVNGFLETSNDSGNQKLFFKAHIENQVADREYYNTEVLAEAGYPILKPVLKATESAAQHVMLYEIVESPTMFDACRALERGERQDFERLVAAQQKSDRDLLDLYKGSLRWADAGEHARSPIHQLFYHRLTGGRYADFYLGKAACGMPFEELARLSWNINGTTYPHTLEQLVARAIDLLHPVQAGPAVAGHGDAHNGNLFYLEEQGELMYFDPAFAGYHSPLLDLIKPLYHNVHAQWMYFPEEVGASLNATLALRDGVAYVEHDFRPTSIRRATRESKTELVLRPLIESIREIEMMAETRWLRPDWKAYMQSAFMCCPLLTMNLCDPMKFPPNVSLLGFAHAVTMGHEDPLDTSL